MSGNSCNPKLKSLTGKALPDGMRWILREVLSRTGRFRTSLHLARMRWRLMSPKPNASGSKWVLNYNVRITDGPNFYIQYKDEFINCIYHFDALRPDPLIVDGGSNIGMSILYFKHVYPQARIIGFEPDPAIFPILKENVNRNNLQGVTLINAGLGAEKGSANFRPDGSSGGQIKRGENGIMVGIERLSDYLNEPVDFLKLNIEGEELPVLQESEASGKLRNVSKLVLEYHGWANEEQRLGAILELLDRQGFRYMIHDFDAETCGASKPPFNLTSQTTWFCLVYARKLDDELDSEPNIGTGR